MQNFSYHTHTNFSDGRNTIDEMLSQAVNLGWKEIGISNHLIIHKNIRKTSFYKNSLNHGFSDMYRDSFEQSLKDFKDHSRFIRETATKYPLKVFIGYETDFFIYKGWKSEFKDFIKEIDYDYLVSGNHYFMSEDGETLYDIGSFKPDSESDATEQFETLLQRHYQTIGKAVESGFFTFLAHLDYARYCPFTHQILMLNEQFKIVQKLKKYGMACELSTKGLRRIDDFYPSEPVVKELIKENVPIVISDDAHFCHELGIDFEKAENLLQKLGCQNRFTLK